MRFLGALLVLAAAALAQARPNQGDIEAGRAALDAGKFDLALASFARASAVDPMDWRGHTYQSLTLVQMAMGESDMRRREGLLREAETVAGELVKRRIVEFHDPLYRFIRGVLLSVQGDELKAYEVLGQALQASAEKYAAFAEIDLHKMVGRAYAVAGTRVALHFITQGQFERADVELEAALQYLPPDDPEQRLLQRLLAATSEGLAKTDKAVGHLRRCIELAKDDSRVKEEMLGTIAIIYLTHEDIKKGKKVLDEAPKESRQPDLVAARCMLVTKEALGDPQAKVDPALAFLRESMRTYPPDNVYRLVLLYRDLLFTKVGPREAGTPEGKALLVDEAIPIFKREVDRRPECPPLYFALYQIYKLLGDAENERRYQDLYERKKKDFEHQEKYDQNGMPRCGN